MKSGYRKFVSAVYVINIVLQGFFTLLLPVGLFLLLGWILNAKCGVAEWVFVPLILLGFLFGFVSMIKFILTAMRQLERLEHQHKESDKGNS